MQSEDQISDEIKVIVPRLRDVSGREAMSRLYTFLRAADVDCELNESGTAITYGPEAEGLEGEFIQSLIDILGARLRAVPTVEERHEVEKILNAAKDVSK